MAKVKYITFETPARIKIHLGKSYTATDYRSQPLPGHFIPFKRDGKWYVCRNEQGGNVWLKAGEFVAEADKTTIPSSFRDFAERINPRQYGFSPMMVALVGAIIGYDYGVIDRKGGKISCLNITSDGYVMGNSTAHDTGAFLGSASDFTRNLSIFRAELSPEDLVEFNRLYTVNVKDWR